MNTIRAWIYRLLVLMGTGFLVYTWFQTWWRCEISRINGWIEIHPWGLEHNMQAFAEYMRGADMSEFFGTLMWIYLGVCVLAILVALFIKDKNIKILKRNFNLPSLIIGIAGLSYIIVVIVAVIFAAVRTGDFYGTKLIGVTRINLGGEMTGDATANLLTGYWLACAAGPIILLLALLRNKITGKS
jgi:hypothetical protein